jgi:hypothetical protein
VAAVKSSSKEQWKGNTTIYVLEEMIVSLIRFEERIVQPADFRNVFKLV